MISSTKNPLGYEGYIIVLQPLALKLIFKIYITGEKLSSPLEEWERNYTIDKEKEIDTIF